MIYTIYVWGDYLEPVGVTYSKQKAIDWIHMQPNPKRYILVAHHFREKDLLFLDVDYGEQISITQGASPFLIMDTLI